jgi:hypothetical protein
MSVWIDQYRPPPVRALFHLRFPDGTFVYLRVSGKAVLTRADIAAIRDVVDVIERSCRL